MSLPASGHHGRLVGVTTFVRRVKGIRISRIQGIFRAVTFYQVRVSDNRSAQYDRLGLVLRPFVRHLQIVRSGWYEDR